MKFTDIKKFTRTSPYSTNVGLDFLKHWLEDQEELNLQLNPDFQRGHVWTTTQQTAYMEYVIRGGKSGRDIYFNHPGWMGSFKGDFVCVDGLQRLTACVAFLNDEIPAFGTLCSEFEDRVRMADVNLIFHVNNLKTKAEVLTWYIEMNTGGTVHTDEEINKVQKMLLTENSK